MYSTYRYVEYGFLGLGLGDFINSWTTLIGLTADSLKKKKKKSLECLITPALFYPVSMSVMNGPEFYACMHACTFVLLFLFHRESTLIGFLGSDVVRCFDFRVRPVGKACRGGEPMIGGIHHVPAKYGPVTASEIPHQGSPRCSFQLLHEISR